MKRTRLAAISCIAAVALSGCEPVLTLTSRSFCAHSMAERRAKFIIDCSRAANPMSDEEGEDLVAQCESTASNLFCQVNRRGVLHLIPGGGSRVVAWCDELNEDSDPRYAAVCGLSRWNETQISTK